MILYLDTSALIKIYVEETGSEAVRSAVEAADAVATHSIAYPETRAALARLRRERRLSDEAFAQVKRAFADAWPSFVRVKAEEPLLLRAGELAELLALRGYDSVHLAAGEYVRIQSGGSQVVFGCFDDRLRHAAGLLGLKALELIARAGDAKS